MAHDSRTVHEIAFSESYLMVNGISIVRFDKDAKNNSLTQESAAARVIARGPMIQAPTRNFGMTWGPSILQSRERLTDKVMDSVKYGSWARGINEYMGLSNAEPFTKSVLNIDGFSSPEFSFTFLLDYWRQKDKFIEYEQNLVELMTSPEISYLTMKTPYDFKPPIDMTPQFISKMLGKTIQDILPLDMYCAILVGQQYFVKGLAPVNISLQPSAAMANRTTPQYYIVNVTMIGGRIPITKEYQDQTKGQYKPDGGSKKI